MDRRKLTNPVSAGRADRALLDGRSPVGAPEYKRSKQAQRFYRRNVWISDEAWDGLRKQMSAKGFGRNMVRRWLAQLPADLDQYEDCRPSWMRDMSISMLEIESAPRMPIWTLELPRLPRTLWLEIGTWKFLVELARHWHISNHQRYDSCSSEISRVGALLEAVGLGYFQQKEDV